MSIYQSYITLQEMEEDAENVSLPVSVLERFALPASQYVAGEIGAFLPVIETRKRTGKETYVLNIPPLLRLTGSVVNDGITMETSMLQLLSSLESAQPCWSYGPYTQIRIDLETANASAWNTEPNSIEIPGVWGMYERSKASGATVATLQSSSATALVVDDGSKVAPGMVALLGTEWEYVAAYGALTAAVTTLGAALDASSEIVTLVSGTTVKIGEVIKVDFEKMKVLDISGNAAYVARGWMQTIRTSHLISASVGVYRTFTVERGVNGSTAAEHAANLAVERMMVPADIGYLTRQIATLMMKKAQTGYAGRSGSADSGETFYLHEFPRDEIARVKSNYLLV